MRNTANSVQRRPEDAVEVRIGSAMPWNSSTGPARRQPPISSGAHSHELALVYRRVANRHAVSETTKQATHRPARTNRSSGDCNLLARSFAGTLATSNMGIANVNTILNRPA